MSDAKPLSFVQSCLLSSLVTQAQLDQAVESWRHDTGAKPGAKPTDEQLSDALIVAGVLTFYQAKQLRQGRTKLTLGPYLITDFIGQGGMGQVFKGVHQVMGRQSAVKVLPLDKSTPEAIASFQREIRLQAQLDHPNLVRAYDAGHDGSVHYLVTEYIAGTDLRRLVRKQGALTETQAASIVRQAALGLDYAHQSGLIHRDVKPGNILVTPEGIAKVSDLGLSACMNEGESDPRAGKIVGTADYLAPEQIRSPDNVTPISDIYSLGCTLYYALTGKVPFPGGSTSNKAKRHLEETPWHPRRFNPSLNEELVEIVADMMEKDPASRIQTAAEVAARLEPWARESSPIPSQQLLKSPWMAPPPPSEREAHGASAHDTLPWEPAAAGQRRERETGEVILDLSPDGQDSRQDSSHQESEGHSSFPSQFSQGTDALTSERHETFAHKPAELKTVPPPPPEPPPAPFERHEPPRLRGVRSKAELQRERMVIALAVGVPTALIVGVVLGVLWYALLG